MAAWFQGPRRDYLVALLLFGGISVAAAITVGKRGAEGRGAFVRFTRQTEGLFEGTGVYRPSHEATGLDEGYPHTPMMALILRPFQALGASAGAATWALFKALLFGIVATLLLRYPRDWGPPLPAWGVPVLVLLSAQVIHLDLTHSNTNLLIGTLVIAALLATRLGRDISAGLLVGLGAVLKVTPLLFLAYFVWKRRWKAVGATLAGIALFLFLVPGLILGFGTNAELLEGWVDQMLTPFLAGAPPNYMKTGHMNQSFTGVFHRLLTDSIAVWPQPRKDLPEIRVNVASLDPGVVSWLVRIASLVVLGVLAWACRTPTKDRRHIANVGEFAVVALAMVFLSERSWREHYVLIGLAHFFLLYDVTVGGATGWRRRAGIAALVVSLVTHHGAWDDLFGKRVALMLQSYGIFLFGGLVLFVVASAVLGNLRRTGFPVPPHTDTA